MSYLVFCITILVIISNLGLVVDAASPTYVLMMELFRRMESFLTFYCDVIQPRSHACAFSCSLSGPFSCPISSSFQISIAEAYCEADGDPFV